MGLMQKTGAYGAGCQQEGGRKVLNPLSRSRILTPDTCFLKGPRPYDRISQIAGAMKKEFNLGSKTDDEIRGTIVKMANDLGIKAHAKKPGINAQINDLLMLSDAHALLLCKLLDIGMTQGVELSDKQKQEINSSIKILFDNAVDVAGLKAEKRINELEKKLLSLKKEIMALKNQHGRY
jgi:hypothetical protein